MSGGTCNAQAFGKWYRWEYASDGRTVHAELDCDDGDVDYLTPGIDVYVTCENKLGSGCVRTDYKDKNTFQTSWYAPEGNNTFYILARNCNGNFTLKLSEDSAPSEGEIYVSTSEDPYSHEVEEDSYTLSTGAVFAIAFACCALLVGSIVAVAVWFANKHFGKYAPLNDEEGIPLEEATESEEEEEEEEEELKRAPMSDDEDEEFGSDYHDNESSEDDEIERMRPADNSQFTINETGFDDDED